MHLIAKRDGQFGKAPHDEDGPAPSTHVHRRGQIQANLRYSIKNSATNNQIA
jgi:hypothetical protein